MSYSQKQDEVAKKALNDLANLEKNKLVANLVSTISTLALFIAPIALSTSTGNWSNLLLLIVYPVLIFGLPLMRYKSSPSEGLYFLGIVLWWIFYHFVKVLPAWYFAIIFGLIYSYDLQFYKIPSLQKRVNDAVGKLK